MQKVLLIEDDPTMSSLLTTLLQIEGYSVQAVPDDREEQILTAICAYEPDIVLMDVNLRQANGLEILRKLRSSDNCAHIRILMSSGLDYKDECEKAGADSFILKPYMPDDLIQQIQALISTP
jgi:DNA-binding response OmpR family regulator